MKEIIKKKIEEFVAKKNDYVAQINALNGAIQFGEEILKSLENNENKLKEGDDNGDKT